MKKNKPLAYVGIGSSAGGLEVLKCFFENTPVKTGMAFIVIQHLAPNYKSLMDELLSKHTDMKINIAKEGMELLPDNIYLIPPNKNMTIKKGKLFPTNQDSSHKIPLPIDIFLKSLAEDQEEKSIAVILSGTGSDGSFGIRSIKESGGFVFIQDPETAKFDGMPKNSIKTGYYDYCMKVEDIPNKLLEITEHPLTSKELKTQSFIKQDSLEKILNNIKKYTGIDFRKYKENTIIRRLNKRIALNGIKNLDDYFKFIRNNRDECNMIANDFLIGVTQFFRDKDAFDYLQENCIDKIIKKRDLDDEKEAIRIWCAGCSTGEEAYSIAILFREYLDKNNLNEDVKIFATDLDVSAIKFAGNGVYSENIINDVSEDRISKFFVYKNKSYHVKENIRSMVLFAQHDLLKDPPFSKMDLIVSRNFLIYLKNNFQQSVIALFRFALKDGGYLFLGPSESIGEMSEFFGVENSRFKFFNARSDSNKINLTNYNFVARKGPMMLSSKAKDMEEKTFDIVAKVKTLLTEKYLPASILVDDNFDVLYVHKEAAKYLSISQGEVSLNFFKLLPKELSTQLFNLINRATKQKKEIVSKDVVLFEEKTLNKINVRVIPLEDEKTDAMCFAIVFEMIISEKIPEGIKTRKNIENRYTKRIEELENELNGTKESLQATVEELETSNEELQSTVEELSASNEELQSSNEELQSVNEELFTVNTEYQKKIEDLTLMNNDFDNLLKNINIGIIFLNIDKEIRLFTPVVKSVINVIDSDIGRSFSHLSTSLDKNILEENIENVINTLIPFEREMISNDGNVFLVRITPYRTVQNKIEGIILSFLDISQIKLLEKNLLIKKDIIKIMDYNPIGAMLLDISGRIIYSNQKAGEILGIEKNDIEKEEFNSTRFEIKNKKNEKEDIENYPFNIVLKTKKELKQYKQIIKREDGFYILLNVNGVPIFNNNKNIINMVFMMEIIKKSKNFKTVLRACKDEK